MNAALFTKRLRFLPLNAGGHSDKVLLSLAISLAAFGLVMVYSASYIFSQEKVGDGLYYFNKHIVFLTIGFTGMTICRFTDYRLWGRIAMPLFFGCLGLVALTFIPGVAHKALGASRWINVGAFTVQPVELAKVALVMLMASRLTREGQDFDKISTGFFFHLWPPALMVSLCMLQPDFGSSALVICTTAFMLYLSGVRLRYLLGSACAVIPFLVGAMLFAPYRRQRVITFLDPWADPQGKGFQIVQSFIAFYRGGLFGAGLGNSRAKVFYLPEAHNDFILSVVEKSSASWEFFCFLALFLC